MLNALSLGYSSKSSIPTANGSQEHQPGAREHATVLTPAHTRNTQHVPLYMCGMPIMEDSTTRANDVFTCMSLNHCEFMASPYSFITSTTWWTAGTLSTNGVCIQHTRQQATW